MIRLQMSYKIFLGVPFFQKKKSIFICDTPAEVITFTSLFRPDGTGQCSNRLRQLQALLQKDIHAYGYKNHNNG